MHAVLHRNGLALRFADVGAGPPVLFQHGLGGDAAQVAELIPAHSGHRWLTLECRAHGESEFATPADFSLATFAEDVLALADRHGLDRFVIGGISMGAAIALRIAVRHPERVQALILLRPAWLGEAAPDNMAPFALVAEFLAHDQPDAARERFLANPLAARLRREAPDNFASLLRFFDRPRPDVTASLLARIARDGPGVSEAQIALVAVPTLVIGTAMDHVHPLATAAALARLVPGAAFVEAAPKAADKALHLSEVRAAIGHFLRTPPSVC